VEDVKAAIGDHYFTVGTALRFAPRGKVVLGYDFVAERHRPNDGKAICCLASSGLERGRDTFEQSLAFFSASLTVNGMSPGSEAELLARCRRGDAEAWDQLFERHYGAAGRFIFQLGFDFTREDVEEICQEVFLTVIKSLDSFQGHSQFQTWLFRVAANKAHDYRQRQHAAKRGGGQVTVSLHNDDPENGFIIDPPSPLPGPDAALIQSEKIALIGQALEQLGGPCQEVIELRYFADLSYEEIAATLDLNPKTVSSRLSKCLDKLEAVTRVLISREKKTPTAV
jgi:RNA polymerase sigma-70 factor (ECF subfamily)